MLVSIFKKATYQISAWGKKKGKRDPTHISNAITRVKKKP